MDWKKLTSDIVASGMSQTAIAQVLGRSNVWVTDVVNGRQKDLKWRDGDRLLALHRARCGDEAAHDERGRRDHELQEVA